MRKYPLFLTTLLLLLSCTSTPKLESGNEKGEQAYSVDWDTQTPVVPIICPNDDDYFFAYQNDINDTLCTNAIARYTRLMSNGGVQLIDYAGDNPKGQTTGYYLQGDKAQYMKGLHFHQTGGAIPGGMGFATTEAFMETHKVLSFENLGDENLQSMPQAVIDSVEARVGYKLSRSYEYCRNAERNLHIYNAQTTPVDSICLGLTILSVSDQLYIMADTAYYYEGEFGWNVDDGGEYFPYQICAITEGTEGIDLWYCRWAPESLGMGALLAREGNLFDYNMCFFYVAYDFTPEPEPVELPATAELTSEYEGWKVWVNKVREPDEDDMEGLFEVYYSAPDDTTKCYLLVSTAEHGTDTWPEGTGKYTSISNICAASSAILVPDPSEGNVRCIISGCPDCRNTYNYMVKLYSRALTYDLCFWFNCNMDFQGADADGHLQFLHYGYNDEGRYHVLRTLDGNNNLLSETAIEL